MEELTLAGSLAALGSVLGAAAAVSASLIVLKLVLIYVKWRTTPLNRIPGPRRPFLSGCFREIRREPFMAPHLRWWDEQRAKSGGGGDDVPLLHYSSLAGRHSVLVLDKHVVHAILSAPELTGGRRVPRFVKRFDFLRSRIGDGLVTLEGKDWMRHRRIIQPSFNTNMLRERLAEVVPPLAERLVECWRGMATAGAGSIEIDVSSHMSAVTLDVVGKVLFSHEFRALEALEEWATAAAVARKSEALAESNVDAAKIRPADSFVSSLMLSFKPNLLSVVLNVMGVSSWDGILNPSVRRTKRALDDAVDGVLRNAKQKREMTAKKTKNSNGDGKTTDRSLLHLLFEAQDPEEKSRSRLGWEELRDEAKTFLMAGHETTATWLYWSLYALAKHPDVQERLYQEVKEAEASIMGKATTLSVEAIEGLEYLDAFLHEALRLYSPVGMISRFNTGPETFAGYDIPPYTRLTLSFFLLHRHPAYWDDPDTFLPERWIDVSLKEMERRKFAFLPFSAGGHNCIGRRFAWMEARLILVPIVRNFVVRIAPSQRDMEHTFTNTITMKSRPALKIVAIARE